MRSCHFTKKEKIHPNRKKVENSPYKIEILGIVLFFSGYEMKKHINALGEFKHLIDVAEKSVFGFELAPPRL